MRLLHDWRWVLRRAWSIKFIAVSVIFSGLEVGMSVFADDPPVPRGTFALLYMAVAMLAFISRLIAQDRDE